MAASVGYIVFVMRQLKQVIKIQHDDSSVLLQVSLEITAGHNKKSGAKTAPLSLGFVQAEEKN
jgi:hypothetical protein